LLIKGSLSVSLRKGAPLFFRASFLGAREVELLGGRHGSASDHSHCGPASWLSRNSLSYRVENFPHQPSLRPRIREIQLQEFLRFATSERAANMPVVKKPSGNTEGPSQYKQPSRKGKKAWRKNVDVTEVQQGLEEVNEKIIRGYEPSPTSILERELADPFAIERFSPQKSHQPSFSHSTSSAMPQLRSDFPR